MISRDLSLAFLPPSLDACAMWRMWVPHLNMPGSNFFMFAERPDWNLISGLDAVCVQRCCTQPQFQFIKVAGDLSQRLIYDLDDNIWDIPDTNPGKILMRYRDGFNNCIRMVDIVTVSTKTLAKELRKHMKFLVSVRTGKEIPVVVVENRIDTRLLVEPIKAEEFIVGWAGSTSHIGDLPIIEPAISKLAKEHPKVTFEFRGLEAPLMLQLFPNVRFRMWMPVPEYMSRMPKWGWSIALAPVSEHEFNNSKSCLKLLEAAYCRIPCLASWMRPYDEFCSHDPELKWLLCAGPSSWEKKLRELINEPAKRDFYGQRMYDVMSRYYSWNKPHEGWQEVLSLLRAMK